MKSANKEILTARIVEALPVPDRDTVFWDRELPGFGVRLHPSGSKVYIVHKRFDGKSRRVTIGSHEVWSLDAARREAGSIMASLKAGQKPNCPGTDAPAVDGPTIAALGEQYMTEHVALRCKPTTERACRNILDRYLLPQFGGLRFGEITPDRVAALHYKLRATPTMANQVIDMLSRLFHMAKKTGHAPDGGNPCRFIKKYPPRSRDRFLSEQEFLRLGAALRELEGEGRITDTAAAALRLLMLTGCRRNEIVSLKWEDVDFEHDEFRLREAKTGGRMVPLSPAAKQVLAALTRRPGNPWVIAGTAPGSRLGNLNANWGIVRRKARLEDVRIHDLRHSFASRGLSLGESLPMIARHLGHNKVQTTAHYAHLARDSVKTAGERVAVSLAAEFGAFRDFVRTCAATEK